MKIHTVILAAGEGSRMLSNKAKSLQPVGGLSMLRRIFDTVSNLTDETSFVVGFEKDSVTNEVEKFSGIKHICEQKKPNGTADAVKSALDSIKQDSKVLVLYGDVPLIKKETLNNLISMTDDSLTILSTELKDPTGYGRVKKNENGLAISIVEEKDASEEDKKINELSSDIENLAINVIRNQTPVATDIRKLTSHIFVAQELERIGDYLRGISRINLKIGDEPFITKFEKIPN